LLKTLRNPRYQ